VTVVTNNLNDGQATELYATGSTDYQSPVPAYAAPLVEPSSPQLFYLVNAINSARNNTNRFPKGTFERLSDVLSVDELTVKSPFLNWQSQAQQRGGITDAAYEQIPLKIMSLLRLGDPRITIYAYGQSLKPAPGSILTSGPDAGVCTNYLITGEVATRTVVRFEQVSCANCPTQQVMRLQLRPVIESFNVLPPE